MYIESSNKKEYYKCNTEGCIDKSWLVWYPNGIPEIPICNSCKKPYKGIYEIK
jgi:hypothetical protein